MTETGTATVELRRQNGELIASGEDLRALVIEHRADLRGANLRGADLSGADLSGAHLSGADLRGADLSGADLRGAYLRGANLRGANLIGADLIGADLRGANLRGADLIGAHLSGADLRGADLSGANLRGANLRGAYLDAPIYQLGPLGSRRDQLVYQSGIDELRAGCWVGTLEEFEARVAKVYGADHVHGREYAAAIAFLRALAAAKEAAP